MVVGIVVTVASVVYHYNGAVCYTSLFNSMLGLTMYSSYFVLFLQVRPTHTLLTCRALSIARGRRLFHPPPQSTSIVHLKPIRRPCLPCPQLFLNHYVYKKPTAPKASGKKM